MKPTPEDILEKTGLWNEMWKPVQEEQICESDAEILADLLLGKAVGGTLEGRRTRLADSLRSAVYKTSTYISALSYIIFQQKSDYFERAGQAGVDRSLLLMWLGSGVFILDSLRDVVDRLDELSMKYTLRELIEAQHEASFELGTKLPLYSNRREVNSAFERLGVNDRFIAAWKPHAVGVSFIFGVVENLPGMSAGLPIITREYSRSVNLHAGLCRTSECSDADQAYVRRSVLSRLYKKSGFIHSGGWLSELHEKRTKALKKCGLDLDILEESIKDACFHGAPYLQKHALHGNAYFGQIGLSDSAVPEASVYEVCRSAMQAYNQIAIAQAAHFRKTQPKHASRLLFLACVRAAKDHDFSRGEYYGNITLAVSLILLRYVSPRKSQIQQEDVRKLEATLAIVLKTYTAHRNHILARLRKLSFEYGGEKLTLATLTGKVRREVFQSGMTELDVNAATWEQVRRIMKRGQDVYSGIFAAEHKTLQTMINRIFALNYNRHFVREKPLAYFWEKYERDEMKRTFPNIWS